LVVRQEVGNVNELETSLKRSFAVHGLDGEHGATGAQRPVIPSHSDAPVQATALSASSAPSIEASELPASATGVSASGAAEIGTFFTPQPAKGKLSEQTRTSAASNALEFTAYLLRVAKAKSLGRVEQWLANFSE
jgi:hypothetical protein